jgi:succinyl-diaminopimelate desuccinylase
MKRLGYDEVFTDEVGNVLGTMGGDNGPFLLLNGHMDHVDPGEQASWPYPPYSAEVKDGHIWGLGAADMKAALAAQVYAVGLLRRAGLPLPGRVMVAAVVMEEVSGLGTRFLARHIAPNLAIVGEASRNRLMRGHRGRVELVATVKGRPGHASAPERAVNPHYSLAQFLARLRDLPMATDPTFGASTVAPTLYLTDQTSSNVIPGEARLHLDWRNVPGEATEEVVTRLNALLQESLIPDSGGTVEVLSKELTAYTGYQERCPSIFPSFSLPEEYPWLVAAKSALEEALGCPVDVGTWCFATDGGHLMAAGVPVIGFGPGDEAVVHTPQERIAIEETVEAVVGYMALIIRLLECLEDLEDIQAIQEAEAR